MTKQEEQDFKRLIIEALSSKEGKQTIQEAVLGVFNSKEGQEAIEKGALKAIGSKEGKDIFSEEMTEWYRDVMEQTLEDMWDDIRQLKTEVRHMREKNDLRFQRLERKSGIASP